MLSSTYVFVVAAWVDQSGILLNLRFVPLALVLFLVPRRNGLTVKVKSNALWRDELELRAVHVEVSYRFLDGTPLQLMPLSNSHLE